jgi:DNA-binding GntR family transcriptional regulator
MLVSKQMSQEDMFERERGTDAKVLAAIIRAELSLQKNVCISDLMRRLRLGEIVINNAINRLDIAGLLDIDNRRDNCRFVRASEKGYNHAGIKRPIWMEA